MKLAFTDRLLVTLICLRHHPHAALAELYQVDHSTVSAAVREIRPLLAALGLAAPDPPGIRIHTLEDLFAYAAAENIELRIDGTETQVRRPRLTARAGRRSSRARRSRTRSRPPASATARAASCSPAWSGPAGCTTRRPCAPRHRRTVPAPPAGQGQGRRRLPRASRRVPRPDQCAAEEARRGCLRRRTPGLPGGQATAILGEDLR